MKLTWERRRLQLRHPFNIARSTRDANTEKVVLLVRIEQGGQVGWGEAAAVSYYHQSLDSAEAALDRIKDQLGDDPFAFERIHTLLWQTIPDQPATIAAIDGALHDLAGKTIGLPVWRWLGLDPKRLPMTSFTIGIDEPAVVARKVREAAAYPILKIKIGTPQDEAILDAVRAEAPEKILRVDANCGWRSETVLERCRALAPRYRFELIEQPTPAGDHAGLAAVRAEGFGPLVADESCRGPADVLSCAGHFDGINIKLSKCGGIRPALQMIHTARTAGLKIMLGCMVETSVGIAAATAIAPLVDWVDLDGHLLLADDPFEGIGGQAGRLTLNHRPGLGVLERS